MRLRPAALLAATLLAACGSSDEKTEKVYPASRSQTGALAVAQVGGKAKVYAAVQNSPGVVRVFDGSRTGSGAARLREIALDPTAFASGISGDDSVMIAFGVTYPKIWFIDPATDTVTKTLTLDAAEYGAWNFSGRSGSVSGVVVDSPRRRAYAGIWNGFAVIDLDRQAVVGKILAAPSESFGFDPVGNRIIAPFYSCALATAPGASSPACPVSYTAADGVTPMDHGLQVIDLKDSPPTVYLLQDAGAASVGAPLGPEPDSATFDRTRGVAVIAVEGTGKHEVLDLGQATFVKASKSFTLPPAGRRTVDNAPLTSVAMADDGSASLCQQEFSDLLAQNNLIGVYGPGATGLRRGRIPNLPGGAPWENNADPHGTTVVTVGGKAVGFVLDDARDTVARIDLAAFLAITPAGDLDEAGTSPAVTFLDGTVAAP